MSDSISASFRVPKGVTKCLDSGNRRGMDYAVLSRCESNATYVTATNGKVLAIRKCDGESDGNYLVPKDVIDKGKGGVAELSGAWKLRVPKKPDVSYGAVEPENYCYPDAKNIITQTPREDECVVVGVDAKQLAILAEALSETSDTHYIYLMIQKDKPNAMIHVAGDSGIGVVATLRKEKPGEVYEKFDSHLRDWRGGFSNEEIRQRYAATVKK